MRVIIIGRLIQGFGSGGMDVIQIITISDITTLRENPLYMEVNAVLYSIGAIADLIVSGVFTEYVTWRWFGSINLPILDVCFGLGFCS
jgi:MFS family permease